MSDGGGEAGVRTAAKTPSVCVFGAVLAAWAAVVRATVSWDPFPYWDADPTRAWVPMTGFGPAAGVGLDLVVVLGSLLMAIGSRRVPASLWVLFGVGVCVVGLHASPWVGGSVEHGPLGSAWIAGLAAVLGLSGLRAGSRTHRLVAAGVVGVLALLLAKALGQVLIEHPATVAAFEANRDEVLASRGWTADSPMARTYERRLRQPDPGAWFGLSNVLATFFAAGMVGFLVAAWRARAMRHIAAWLGLVGLAMVVGLVLTGSKGAAGAAGVAAAAFLAGLLVRRVARLEANRAFGVAAVGAVFVVLVGVVARGFVGERVGELSLLFRSQYLSAAAEIIGAHPLMGVGPDGFRDAYAIAKPALSPESVTSPHSVGAEWLSALGVGGLAWAAAGLAVVYRLGVRLGRSLLDTRERVSDVHRADRREVRVLALFIVAAAAPGVLAEQALMTPESAGVRLAGLGAWFGVAWLVSRLATGSLAALLASAGVVIAVHGQIEMTPTWINGAPLVGVLVGLGLASADESDLDKCRSRLRGAFVAGTVCVIGLGVQVSMLGPLWAWQRHLTAAAEAARPIGELSNLAGRIGEPGGPSIEAVSAELAALVGASPARSGEAFARQVDRARNLALTEAAPSLRLAGHARPRHIGTARAVSTAMLSLGNARDAIAEAERLAAVRPEAAAAWALLGRVQEAAGDGAGAIEAWQRADELDPYDLLAPAALMRLQLATGDTEAAAEWARVLLERNDLKRLDPMVGLSEAALREARRVAAGTVNDTNPAMDAGDSP